ncbi:MAG: aminodeoxychorismate synthase, component I [Phycisphaerae bacterium]|nr:MAG: aminodeoxychorismate synthase, component I [Phycisphaerae bacterium]
MSARPITLDASPASAAASWPAAMPLAAWWAGDAQARWSILARPSRLASAAEARDRLARPLPASSGDGPPFTGGLLGALSYDAGRTLEPIAQSPDPPRDDRRWPDHLWLHCPDALVHDAATGQWWSVGDGASLALALAPRPATPVHVGPLRSSMSRTAYLAAVHRVLEYIRAGDVYQVNLAHCLTAPFRGSARALWLALGDVARPRFGAYLEADLGPRRLALASASPELFLHFDPASRRLATRPMKGTRPDTPGADADLLASPKDRAELAMIVDLLRNDLGRACDLGSVRVDDPRRLEYHGGDRGRALWQTTALVSGRVRDGASALDLLAATFPGGSITGAPKIRAMQIIDELEPVRRGPYCGAVGYFSDSGHAAFNIAIRTAAIAGQPDGDARDAIRGQLDWGVGAGIVAESDPAAEWDETLAKSGVLRAALAALARHADTECPA